MFRRTASLFLAVLSAGCVSIPMEAPPDLATCEIRPHLGVGGSVDACERKTLTVGFFPRVGEVHQNRLATNGRPLTAGLRVADYTLRPLAIIAQNVLSLGIRTGLSLLTEVYSNYATSPGACGAALIGYCKGVKLIQLDDPPAAVEP